MNYRTATNNNNFVQGAIPTQTETRKILPIGQKVIQDLDDVSTSILNRLELLETRLTPFLADLLTKAEDPQPPVPDYPEYFDSMRTIGYKLEAGLKTIERILESLEI